jgi:glycosyltransferase involved in cell wall biosynthesis
MCSKKKIVFLTTLYSPFHIELSRLLNDTEFYYGIIFTKKEEHNRGTHWNKFEGADDNVFIIESNYFLKYRRIYDLLCKIDPDLVIIAGTQDGLYIPGKIFSFLKKRKYGFWAEQPNQLKSKFEIKLRKFRDYFVYGGAEKLLCIGERAVEYYSRYGNSVLIPYAQDLEYVHEWCFARKEKKEGGVISFLFSGQLVARHNIDLILMAIKKLFVNHKGKFRFIIAGKGELLEVVKRFIDFSPELFDCIIFDNEYELWEDRLRPFADADVLVYPSKHSGWGLVVPEALACGLPVITTKNVESARYFIKNGENGVFVEENVNSIYMAMASFIEKPHILKEMSQYALKSYYKGDIRTVSHQMRSVFNELISAQQQVIR